MKGLLAHVLGVSGLRFGPRRSGPRGPISRLPATCALLLCESGQRILVASAPDPFGPKFTENIIQVLICSLDIPRTSS